jgi:hypothetical protein
MRRTRTTLIYRQTKNLRAVQLLLGHSKVEGTVRYPGIEVDDALEIAEKIDVQGLVSGTSDPIRDKRNGGGGRHFRETAS